MGIRTLEQLRQYIVDKISALQKDKGLTDRAASIEMDLNESYLNSIRNGRHAPKLDKLLEIINYFDLDFEDFFDTSIKQPTRAKRLCIELERLLTDEQMEMLEHYLSCLEKEDVDSYERIIKSINHKQKR